MKEFFENILAIGMVICILLMFYGTYAVIWEFNPFDIVAFNHKLLGSALFTFVMFLIIFKISYKSEEERK